MTGEAGVVEVVLEAFAAWVKANTVMAARMEACLVEGPFPACLEAFHVEEDPCPAEVPLDDTAVHQKA